MYIFHVDTLVLMRKCNLIYLLEYMCYSCACTFTSVRKRSISPTFETDYDSSVSLSWSLWGVRGEQRPHLSVSVSGSVMVCVNRAAHPPALVEVLLCSGPARGLNSVLQGLRFSRWFGGNKSVGSALIVSFEKYNELSLFHCDSLHIQCLSHKTYFVQLLAKHVHFHFVPQRNRFHGWWGIAQ